MIFEIILLIVMIGMVLIIIATENNLKLVIMLSAFSLIASSIYFIYNAPDVALAEVSIGCGVVPLIFIVAISKQKEFIVINHIKRGSCKTVLKILEEFCSKNNLKLKVLHSAENHIHGIFREKNIDLIMERCTKTSRCIIKVKESNILVKKLEKMTKNMNNITVIKEGENETLD